MKKIHTLFLLAFFSSLNFKSQVPNFSWAKQLGGASTDFGNSVALDPSGNVFTTGSFNGTADFDPGGGTFNMSSLGGNDVFISKLDASGNFVWAKQIGDVGPDGGTSLSVDAFGNIYVTGGFNGTPDFDPGAGTFTMSSFGADDVFIVKLDNSGNFIWAKQLGGNGPDYGNSIYVNSTGVVYLTGYFSTVADFDPGAGTYTLASVGNEDAYVSKLDPSGNFIFAKGIGGSIFNDEGKSIAVDPGGNIVYTGDFSGTVDMDPGAAVLTFTSVANSIDIFVSKLDGNGNFTWARQMGNSGVDGGYGVTIGAFNDCYVTGYFNNTVDFDPGAATYTLSSAGSDDIFVTKLDVSGNFVWAKGMGGPGSDIGISLSYNSTGIYTTGWFSNTSDFDPGAGTYTLASNGSKDGFVSKLDAAGNFLFAQGIGGIASDYGIGILSDPQNNVYLTGNFQQNSVDFDPTSATYTMSSFGNSDAFVTKWGQCIKPNAPTITTSAANLNICASGSVTLNAAPNGTITWYTSPSGTTSVGTGNSYTTPILTVTTTYYAEALTCASSASRTPVTITVSSIPTLSVAITNSVICVGGFSKIIASGAGTYLWTGGILNGLFFAATVTTVYTVTGTSAYGCTSTATATITVNPSPTISIVSTTSLLCVGESATITANGLTNYGWDNGALTSTILVSPTITTSYSVSGNGSNGCTGSSAFTQSVSPCIGIKEFSKSNETLLIYPNPGNGNFTISTNENMELNIINEFGQVVKSISLNESNHHLVSMTDLPYGIYFVYGKTQTLLLSAKVVIIAP